MHLLIYLVRPPKYYWYNGTLPLPQKVNFPILDSVYLCLIIHDIFWITFKHAPPFLTLSVAGPLSLLFCSLAFKCVALCPQTKISRSQHTDTKVITFWTGWQEGCVSSWKVLAPSVNRQGHTHTHTPMGTHQNRLNVEVTYKRKFF